jgi:hypothetical protein
MAIASATAASGQETAARPPVVLSDEARKLHAETLLIDGHNDLPVRQARYFEGAEVVAD